MDIRKFFSKHYSASIPWDAYDPGKQHAGFQSLWLQFDHVVPHSHGCRSDLENVVVSCALCNFGKHGFTLRQLGLIDPRLREPIPSIWDGLERLRALLKAPTKLGLTPSSAPKIAVTATNDAPSEGRIHTDPPEGLQAFFMPEARFSNGYLLTPPINGKERWFRITGNVTAEPVARQGIQGFRLVCPPSHLRRRGIDLERLLDVET